MLARPSSHLATSLLKAWNWFLFQGLKSPSRLRVHGQESAGQAFFIRKAQENLVKNDISSSRLPLQVPLLRVEGIALHRQELAVFFPRCINVNKVLFRISGPAQPQAPWKRRCGRHGVTAGSVAGCGPEIFSGVASFLTSAMILRGIRVGFTSERRGSLCTD